MGADLDDDGGSNRGAVHTLFLYSDGTVKAEQKISSTQGGLVGPLDNEDLFGVSVGSLGDVDGDGVWCGCVELAESPPARRSHAAIQDHPGCLPERLQPVAEPIALALQPLVLGI